MNPQSVEPPTYHVGMVVLQSTRIFFRYFIVFGLITVVVGIVHLSTMAVFDQLWPFTWRPELSRLYAPMAGGITALFYPRIIITLVYQTIMIGVGPVLMMATFVAASAHVVQEGRFRAFASLRSALRQLPSLMIVWLILAIVLYVIWTQSFAAAAAMASTRYVLPWLLALCTLMSIGIGVLGWPVVGVMTVERLGPVQGLKRGIRIGRGARWRTIAILLVTILITMSWILALGALEFMIAQFVSLRLYGTLRPVFGLFFAGTLFCWVSVVMGVSYLRLRQDREGMPVSNLAAVFD